MAQRPMANDHSPVKSNFRLIIPLGLLASVAAASHCFVSRAESLRAAVAGSGAHSGWLDRFAAAGYALGGLPGVDAARALCIATPVLAAFFGISLVAQRFPAGFKKQVHRMLVIAALVMAGFGFFNAFQSWQRDVRNIRLLAPLELLDAAGAVEGRIFMNSAALSASRLLAPDIVSRAPDNASIPELTSSPLRWREEERREPFAAIVLAAPLESSRPLVDRLASSPEWKLARIDNQGLLYLRRSSEKDIPSPASAFADRRDQALHDAQSALVMHFLGENKKARDLMSKACLAAPGDPVVLIHSATLAATLKQWSMVRQDAEAALQGDSSSTQARSRLALALLETGNISGAARESASLAASSNLPSVLWLQARISREANDPTAEITALEKLLSLAKKQNEAPTLIHIHLAQAWAKRGFAAQALEHYDAALEAPLPPKQKQELEKARDTIQSRTARP